MKYDVLPEIKQRLVADFKMVTRGQWLRQGRCPDCKAKELYTHAETPWVLKCGRLNNCGYERHARDLYPELFEKFNERYQPTMERPNATADAYMEIARGFDTKALKGWYRQENFQHPYGDKGTATVRFDIDRINNVFMERLIEPVTITQKDGSKKSRKAHFGGSHRGLWWQPPGLKIEKGDAVWITEGCLDAIALNLNGVKAVSMLSAGNYPENRIEAYKDLGVTWIFALDHDTAGRNATLKWVKKAVDADHKASAAQIPAARLGAKSDWNDLHQAGKLTEKDIEDYLYHGQLLLAASAKAKAVLMWTKNQKPTFSFTFDNRVFWFSVDLKAFVAEEMILEEANPNMEREEIREMSMLSNHKLKEICNCNPVFLYFQSHEATEESWYYARISFPKGRKEDGYKSRPSLKTTFTGSQIASSAEFKKRLLTVAPGGLFTGAGNQLDWIVSNHLNNIKQVKTIDYVGYSQEHAAYIFNDFAVHDGRVYKANSEDYIEIEGLSIKTLSHGFPFNIGEPHTYTEDWPRLIYDAFGAKGLAALTYWFGSLFAEQIRAAQKSFPFLEIVGEPGSGKTTLIEFLWQTFGLENTEGFDPSKSTFAAVRRKLAQVSNMPVVLLEGDRDEDNKYKSFDFDQLKDLYNGRPFGERGIKNGGNETYAPSFKAAIVIAQNATVQASDAVLQRIVHLQFDKDDHSIKTREAADALNAIPAERVSYFMVKAMLQERKVMAHVIGRARAYEDELLTHPKIKSFRTAKNHGQLMALADCVIKLTGLSAGHRNELHAYIEGMAVTRESAIKADVPALQEFWSVFEYLEGQVDHSKDPDIIAVNLHHFAKMAALEKQVLPPLSVIRPLLKQSRTHTFQEVKTVNSRINSGFIDRSQSVKCWTFARKTKAA